MDPRNLVMTSAYARMTVRTDSEGWGNNPGRVGKGMTVVCLAFWFSSKLTILGATKALVQNLDLCFLCSTDDKI